MGKEPDDYLLSHGQSALSSAWSRFTVLFGMGRGGAGGLWSSGVDRKQESEDSGQNAGVFTGRASSADARPWRLLKLEGKAGELYGAESF